MESAPLAGVIWRPQPGPQHAFVQCSVFDVVYGGARGGGKTDANLGDWALHAKRYGRHAKGLFVRRKRVDLEPTIERARQIFQPLGAQWHEQKSRFIWPSGATIYFRYLDRDEDADHYQGHDYTRVYVEELTQFVSPKPVNKLKATLRSAAGVPCKFRASCNPGGPGHTWVKARYIDNGAWNVVTEDFSNPFTGEVMKLSRVFIPARLTDNALLMRVDPLYVAKLQQAGSKELVRAWLEGDWDIVEGAFFDGWSSRNVVRPFQIPAEWMRFRSFDWGFAAPFSVQWWAVATDDLERPEGIIPRGALVHYREWYGSNGKPNEGLRLTADAVAEGIKAKEAGEKVAYGVADPSIFKEDGGPSHGERMRRAGVNWRPADNARVAKSGAMGGWDQMRQRINPINAQGESVGRPMLYVFDTCRDFLRTVPTLQHDPDRPEDLDTTAEDHCFVGSTLIATPNGPARIDELGSMGRCIGPDGRPTPFHSPRITRRAANLVRLAWADGTTTDCTPDHRFLTKEGWREASTLAGAEILCASPSSARAFRSSRAFATTAVVTISRERASDFIARSGRACTALFRKALTSITRTMTGATTTLPISVSSMERSIYATTAASLGTAASLSSRQSQPPPLGTALRMDASGTAPTTREASGQSWRSKAASPASSAETTSTARATWPLSSNGAGQIAKRVRCVAVEPLSEPQDVWCMTVPKWEAFALHNGAIAHNCADAARYACMSRPVPAIQAVKPNNPPDLWSRTNKQADGWRVA